METSRRFTAKIEKSGSICYLPIPFDPDDAWGPRDRHCLTGTISGHGIRGTLRKFGDVFGLPLGPAWRKCEGLEAGAKVEAVLLPEGPKSASLASDIPSALESNDKARAFFDSLPTFYRKNYIRWIEAAKRPETRAARIREMIRLLSAGMREK
ncbi:MAG: DUF1905 domain-containing protein [Armatimonadetes bacterium]|nr:DUF1905 domain-containing protein [Armatimonadota bacterium]